MRNGTVNKQQPLEHEAPVQFPGTTHVRVVLGLFPSSCLISTSFLKGGKKKKKDELFERKLNIALGKQHNRYEKDFHV